METSGDATPKLIDLGEKYPSLEGGPLSFARSPMRHVPSVSATVVPTEALSVTVSYAAAADDYDQSQFGLEIFGQCCRAIEG